MKSKYKNLEQRQNAFNTYITAVVHPMLGLENEIRDLRFVEIAWRIDDPDIRERYCTLAISMLEANIFYHLEDVTADDNSKQIDTLVIVSTLLIAATAYHFGNASFSLIAAALWYGFANGTYPRWIEKSDRQVEYQVEVVTEWAGTIQEWGKAREELRSLQLQSFHSRSRTSDLAG